MIREALRALADGEPRLVRIGPPGSEADAPDDVVVATSMCASEGTVEVLVEPQLPAPLLAVLGDGPAARTLARARARRSAGASTPSCGEGADAVVVATMGHGDEEALEVGARGRAGYVGLVASARRAGVVLDALRARGLDEEALARVRSPAGLDLGPRASPRSPSPSSPSSSAWSQQSPRGAGSAAGPKGTAAATHPSPPRPGCRRPEPSAARAHHGPALRRHHRAPPRPKRP